MTRDATSQLAHDFVNGSQEYPGQLDPDNQGAVIQFMERHWRTVQVWTGWYPTMLFLQYPHAPYMAFWAATFITYWEYTVSSASSVTISGR